MEQISVYCILCGGPTWNPYKDIKNSIKIKQLKHFNFSKEDGTWLEQVRVLSHQISRRHPNEFEDKVGLSMIGKYDRHKHVIVQSKKKKNPKKKKRNESDEDEDSEEESNEKHKRKKKVPRGKELSYVVCPAAWLVGCCRGLAIHDKCFSILTNDNSVPEWTPGQWFSFFCNIADSFGNACCDFFDYGPIKFNWRPFYQFHEGEEWLLTSPIALADWLLLPSIVEYQPFVDATFSPETLGSYFGRINQKLFFDILSFFDTRMIVDMIVLNSFFRTLIDPNPDIWKRLFRYCERIRERKEQNDQQAAKVEKKDDDEKEKEKEEEEKEEEEEEEEEEGKAGKKKSKKQLKSESESERENENENDENENENENESNAEKEDDNSDSDIKRKAKRKSKSKGKSKSKSDSDSDNDSDGDATKGKKKLRTKGKGNKTNPTPKNKTPKHKTPNYETPKYETPKNKSSIKSSINPKSKTKTKPKPKMETKTKTKTEGKKLNFFQNDVKETTKVSFIRSLNPKLENSVRIRYIIDSIAERIGKPRSTPAMGINDTIKKLNEEMKEIKDVNTTNGFTESSTSGIEIKISTDGENKEEKDEKRANENVSEGGENEAESSIASKKRKFAQAMNDEMRIDDVSSISTASTTILLLPQKCSSSDPLQNSDPLKTSDASEHSDRSDHSENSDPNVQPSNKKFKIV